MQGTVVEEEKNSLPLAGGGLGRGQGLRSLHPGLLIPAREGVHRLAFGAVAINRSLRIGIAEGNAAE
ncbi:MAG: hypothetical protein Kow0096_13420 [Thiohalomonadaceae bacterium]